MGTYNGDYLSVDHYDGIPDFFRYSDLLLIYRRLSSAGRIHLCGICKRGIFPTVVCLHDQSGNCFNLYCKIPGNRILKVIMTVFSCCTFIMIASSAMRMILYVQTYQLTFLRVLVLWALVVISLLLIGCMVTVYRTDFPLFLMQWSS